MLNHIPRPAPGSFFSIALLDAPAGEWRVPCARAVKVSALLNVEDKSIGSDPEVLASNRTIVHPQVCNTGSTIMHASELTAVG
jgi:hypothetical protein